MAIHNDNPSKNKYANLSRASLSYNYLHTNSTTHEFLFGALAELVDNSRDANSTKLSIYSVRDNQLRGGFLLCFLDDGKGMNAEQANNVMTFGMSSKKSNDTDMIGMYGNGLKSGSMRIGNDFIMFTKQENQMSCILLSRTFHQEEMITEVVVPIPVFSAITKKSIAVTYDEIQKVKLEMEIIYKYSPFNTEAELMRQFDLIDQGSGTLVVVYNLKLMDNGEPELDIKTDSLDIRMSACEISDVGLPLEKKSFRAYASVLYVDPRMRLYIQGKKVRSRKLVNTLYKSRVYTYTSNRFKARADKAATKAIEDVKSADMIAREAESKARNYEKKYNHSKSKKERSQLRRAQQSATEMRADYYNKKNICDRKQKDLKETKTLKFYFGININNKGEDGMFIYNCSRLIKMYTKVGPQLNNNRICAGIMGVVDVPYLVLEPTHNKQDFANAKEYRLLLKSLAEYMGHYWRDINIESMGLEKFWDQFGYSSLEKRVPSIEKQYMKRRAMQVNNFIQCDLCLKWRKLPFQSNSIGKMYPDNWHCSMNPDKQYNRCSTTEQRISIHTNIFKKQVKSIEQKKDELCAVINRKQAEINIYKQTTPSSDSSDMEEVPTRHSREKKLFRIKLKRKIHELASDDDDDDLFDVSSIIEIHLDNKWHIATIISKNDHRKTYKIKFQDKPEDCNDKWIKWRTANIKQHSQPINENTSKVTSSTASTSSNSGEHHGETTTTTSSTASSSTTTAQEHRSYHDSIADGYRTCIRYFLPPTWTYTKDMVSQLESKELASFPLDELFYNYEIGLRKLVSTIQPDDQKLQVANTNLQNNRKLVVKLLKSINTEFEIEDDCTSEKVDQLLEQCVLQLISATPTVEYSD